MKKTIKLLSLVMALCLCLASFTGCGLFGEDDEALITEVAEGYLAASCEMDFDEAEKYVLKDSDAAEEIEESAESWEASFADMTDNGAEDFPEKMLKAMDMSYEIEEIEIKEDKATVTATVKMKNPSDADYDQEELSNEMGSAYAKENGMSEEDLMNMTVLPENFEEDFMKFSINYAADHMIDLVENLDHTEEETELTLKKEDGEWLIIKTK